MAHILFMVLLCLVTIPMNASAMSNRIDHVAVKILGFKDHIITDYVLETNAGKLSLMECLILCYNNIKCQTFFYNVYEGWCQTNRFGVMSQGLLLQSIGADFYELRHTRCPVELGYYFIRAGNMCYNIYPEIMSWFDARASCQSEGGDLAILDSVERYNHIVMVVASNPVLSTHFAFNIGCSNVNAEEIWRWLDGSIFPLSSGFWGAGQPDTVYNPTVYYYQRYGTIVTGYDNKIHDGHLPYGYVCEIRVAD